MVPLKQITTKTYARRELDEEWVQMLMDLIRNGEALPPIDCTEDLDVIDGRHRMEAYKRLGYETVKVHLHPAMSDPDKIRAAMKANLGGPLPPKPKDLSFVFMSLARVMTNTQIRDHFAGVLNTRVVAREVRRARSNLLRFKVYRAADLVVSDNLTPAQAAKRGGVEVDQVRDILQKRTKDAYPIMQELLAKIEAASRHASGVYSNAMRQARDLAQEGTLTRDQAAAVMKRTRESGKRQVKTADQHLERLMADPTIDEAPHDQPPPEPPKRGDRPQ
jgi:ParB-like chromosome segregation protein Spo0J